MSDDHLKDIDSSYMVFTMGEEEYAIPLSHVSEATEVPEIVPVPETPDYFLGMMNLRGLILSVIDLRKRFKITAVDTGKTAVIICDYAPLSFGVIVDRIKQVVVLKEEDIQEKPDMKCAAGPDYVVGIGQKDDRCIFLLDLVKSLDLQDRVMINNILDREVKAV